MSYRLGAALVPLYESLSDADLVFIIEQAKISTVAVASISVANRLIDHIAPQCPTLHSILLCLEDDEILVEEDSLKTISIDEPTVDIRPHDSTKQLRVLQLSSIAKLGKETMVANGESYVRPPSASDIATICYTSGTTGRPKGVMLRHRNIVAVCAAGVRELGVTKEDRYLSFLPLPVYNLYSRP